MLTTWVSLEHSFVPVFVFTIQLVFIRTRFNCAAFKLLVRCTFTDFVFYKRRKPGAIQ
jgi:hypothetical protein